MTLMLPNLDDRRWADLVEEARALIPFYAPGWTDHNAHDPGITLLELFAWIAEMDLYWVNRVPAGRKWKFLRLVGVEPLPPRPASTVLRLTPRRGLDEDRALTLPAGVEFEGQTPHGQPVLFRTRQPITLTLAQLQTVQAWDGAAYHDLTARWQRGAALAVLGDDPRPGAALYLGFDRALPVDQPVSLWIALDGVRTGADERARLLAEARIQGQRCQPPPPLVSCTPEPAPDDESAAPLLHHSARIVWEYWAGDAWQPVDVLTDDTRALTLSGALVVRAPGEMQPTRLGELDADRCYLRCRMASGAYDAAPLAAQIVLNGLAADQLSGPAGLTWTIAAGAEISGLEPQPGEWARLHAEFDAQGVITRLSFAPESDLPPFFVLAYQPPQPSTPGQIALEAEAPGVGTGRPDQQIAFSAAAVVPDSLQLVTLEAPDAWQMWTPRPDFDASTRDAAHYVLDAGEGVVQFGDGELGRVVPRGTPIIAAADFTQAEAGNLAAGTIRVLARTARNEALLGGLAAEIDEKEGPVPRPLDVIRVRLGEITNPLPATGGTSAETLAQASARALETLRRSSRAVTLDDYEALAFETPGVNLARVTAFANRAPGLPCITAPGMILVVVVPHLPPDRPTPSAGLKQAVAAYLTRRQVLGTQTRVVGPVYRDLAVRASVRAYPRTDPAALTARIAAALDQFFHPLHGGPDGTGWPLGRDVYLSEVQHVIDSVPGVDHILKLELVLDCDEAVCGNVCLGPTGLVAAGAHEIKVVSA